MTKPVSWSGRLIMQRDYQALGAYESVERVVLTPRLLRHLAAHPLFPMSPHAKAIHEEAMLTQAWIRAYE